MFIQHSAEGSTYSLLSSYTLDWTQWAAKSARGDNGRHIRKNVDVNTAEQDLSEQDDKGLQNDAYEKRRFDGQNIGVI